MQQQTAISSDRVRLGRRAWDRHGDDPIVAVLLPRAAHFHIAKKAIERVAYPARNRCQGFDVRLIGQAVNTPS